MNEKITEQLANVDDIKELGELRRLFLDEADKRERQIYNGMTFRQRMVYPNQRMRLVLAVVLIVLFFAAIFALDSGAFGQMVADGPILSPPDNVADLVATESFAVANAYIVYAAPVAFMIAGFALGTEIVYGITSLSLFFRIRDNERVTL